MSVSPKKQNYQRVPGGSGRGRFTGFNRSSLWLADDHLLLIELRVWSERYYRFYFKDIQAFIFLGTNDRLRNNLIQVALVTFFLWLAKWVETDVLSIFWMICAGIFSVGMLFNSLAGRGCQVSIKTRVQNHRIGCLNRWPKAIKIINRIRPLVDTAQVNLKPLGQENSGASYEIEPATAPILQMKTSKAHWAHVSAWFVMTMAEVIEALGRSLWTWTLSIPAHLFLLSTLVWALVLHRKYHFSPLLKLWVWSGLAMYTLMSVSAIVTGYRLLLSGASGQWNSFGLVQAFLLTPLDSEPWLKMFYMIFTSLVGLVTLLGAMVCFDSASLAVTSKRFKA